MEQDRLRECPVCVGHEPNEALVLEELKALPINTPVWTVTNGVEGSGRWELFEYKVLKASPMHAVLSLTNAMDGQADYPIDTYGKTWLAYPHKPATP